MNRDTNLAWFAVIFSGIAAIGSFLLAGAVLWAVYQGREPAKVAAQDPPSDPSAVVIRTCDIGHSGLMHTGDDLLMLDGATGRSDYLSHEGRASLLAASSHRPKYFLECRLKNPSHVSIFNLTFYSNVSYHRGRLRKRMHNDDSIEVLGPGESRTIWIEDKDNIPVIVHGPDRVQYYRFPDMNNIQDQSLQPPDDDFWTLKRDSDPLPSQPS
jgi:hypothetical protein